MGRFNRFLHLERERTQKDPAAPDDRGSASQDPRAARFGAVQTDAAAPSPSPEQHATEGAHTARFDETRKPALTLEDKRAEDQPFIRCCHCEGDNSRYARECQNCHADLDTPAQRAFNERLWAERRAQREAEAQALAEARAAQEQAAEEEAKQKRALFEQMAQDVRRQTEGRLDAAFGESTAFRWRGRGVRLGGTRGDFAGFGIAAVVLLAAAGLVGSCRTALALLPLFVVAGGAFALRWWLRR